MIRCAWGLGAAALLFAAADARPAEAIDGNWKVTLLVPDQPTLWLLKLTAKDDKLAGELLAKAERVPDTTLDEIALKDDALHMVLRIKGPMNEEKVVFDGRVAKEPKKILGSVQLGRQTYLAVLEPTPLTTLDAFDLGKEKIGAAAAPEIFDLTLRLLSQAGEKKAKPEEVRAWAAKAAKAAEPYGPVWQREFALRLVEVLTGGKGDDLAKEALPYARQAERLLTPGDRAAVQKRVLTALAAALTKAGKEEEAKEVEVRIGKIEAVVLAPKYPGRKGAGDRAVLLELFTGAECQPCVAADMAFDGVGRAYLPKEAVLLEYHIHVGGSDPLANGDAEKRQRYYGEELGDGVPNAFFNGKVGAPGGGRADDAQEKYDEFTGLLNGLLENESKVKLKLTATQKGDAIEIAAEASDLATPGEKVRLRLVLVEEQVNYKGGNKLTHFRHVVRAFPGGTAGLALTEKSGKKTATVNVEELRKKLKEYLADYDKDGPFPNKERPLDLKKLSVVAFVQNDTTREVLQAVQVPVAPEAE